MPRDFQVVFDAAQPHLLARWWAELLGWMVEPQDEAFIRRMIAEGHATDADTTTVDGALVWKTGAAIVHPDGSVPGQRRRILFQQVPEGKQVKNRVHLDVYAGAGGAEAEAGLLTARGATLLHRGRQGPHTWITMADPEGNEFCLA
jgi:Glyoxalase-like domain